MSRVPHVKERRTSSVTIILCPFAKLLITCAICAAVFIINMIVIILKNNIKNIDLIIGAFHKAEPL